MSIMSNNLSEFISASTVQSIHSSTTVAEVAGVGLQQVYKIFGHAGFSPTLFGIFVVKWFVCFAGVIFALDLTFITYRTKTLRGSCNIQIALNGVSIAFMEVSAFVPLYLTASGQNFLTLMPCGLIQAIPWFCTIYTNGNGLSIGVDRLLSVLFPFWYMQNDKKWLVILSIFLNSIYAAVFLVLGLFITITRPTNEVLCVPVDMVQEYGTLTCIVLLIVNGGSVLCYLVVWITMALRKSVNRNQKSINKSLSLIVLLELSGWITNYSMRIILNYANVEAMRTWYIVQVSTIAPYLATTISPLVLYIYSLEYRKAFFAQFGKMNNRVGMISTNQLIVKRREVSNLSQNNITASNVHISSISIQKKPMTSN